MMSNDPINFSKIYNMLYEEYAREEGILESNDEGGREYLKEFTVRNFISVFNPRDLPHRDYAPLLKSVNYRGTRGNTMRFFVRNNINGWMTYVRFKEWDEQLRDFSITPVEASRLLLWSGNIEVGCGCPSFKFYGYQYILTQLGAAIVPEVRFPHIRNPHLRGLCCKHLRRSICTLPFHLGDISQAIKFQRQRIESGKQPNVYVGNR